MKRNREWAVLVFACFTAVWVAILAYGVFRNGGPDELGLYNPAYMVSHYGRATYPIFFQYDATIIHPPLHTGTIGLLNFFGFTWYYAEATPVVLWFLLAIWVTVRGVFPASVKMGLLFGIAFLLSVGPRVGFVYFGTRPEGHVEAAWLAGLLLLEDGRLREWNAPRLFAGALALMWASSVHYYAGAAFAGVAVYLVWCLKDVGWQRGRPRVCALIAGAAVFAVPYLAWYVLPHFREIIQWFHVVEPNQQGGVVAVSIRSHFDLYAAWAKSAAMPLVVAWPTAQGIPLMLISTALLFAVRSTRGIALAALPLEATIFLFASHKQGVYLIHEIAIFAAAVAVAVLVAAEWLTGRWLPAKWRPVVLPVAAILFGLYLWPGNVLAATGTISFKPRTNEAEVARAAARRILGPHARVAARLLLWYASGGEDYYNPQMDLNWVPEIRVDPSSLFDNFDAVAEHENFSADTQASQRITISSLYAEGALRLRGFYFSATDPELEFVLLSAHPVSAVQGYAMLGGRLQRFDQDPDGDYELIAAACPSLPETPYERWNSRWPDTASAVLYLPGPRPDGATNVVTILAPRSRQQASAEISHSCRELFRARGGVTAADPDALIRELRTQDTTIRFPRNVEDVPGFGGVRPPRDSMPPAGAVRVDGVLNLSAIRQDGPGSRLERLPQVRVTVPPGAGEFGAALPVSHAQFIPGTCWAQVRLKVLRGRVELSALNGSKAFLADSSQLYRSSEPQELTLKISNLGEVAKIVVRNASGISFPNQAQPLEVEILDAGVFVDAKDWPQVKARMAARGAWARIPGPAPTYPSRCCTALAEAAF
jgi:hypothetical protein